jgi:PAS domain S-box-containing protein
MAVCPETISILLVDDDPEFARVTADFLEHEREAFTVETAANASEGYDRLMTAEFDCVVSDYDMPETNGIEFLETVRSEYPDFPFLLYTGKGSEEIASEAISAGVTDYLQKQSGTEQYTILAHRIENAVNRYTARHAIEQSEQQLSMFVEQSPLGIIEWDEQFTIIEANDTAADILGCTAGELVGRSWADIVPDEDIVDEILAADDGYQTVTETLTDGGEQIVCEWHNHVVTDGEAVVAVVSQFQKLTDDQHRRRRLECMQEAIVELATDDAVVTGDFETALHRISETTATALDVDRVNVWLLNDDRDVARCVEHYTRAEGTHDSGMELVVDDCARYFDSLESEWAVAADNAHADPRTTELADGYLDVHNVGALLDAPIHLDGELIGVVCHEHVGSSRQWRADETQFAGSISELITRTIRNQAFREQRRKRKFRESLLKAQQESIMDAVLVVGDGRDIISYNEQFLDLWNLPEELLEQNDKVALDWVTDNLANPDEFRERVQYLYDHPEQTSYDEIELADGRTLDRYTAPVTDDDGTYYGRLWTFRDITERKERERELHRQNERLEQLASVISHDLRNPLTVADLELDLLGDECDSEHLDAIEQAHERMRTLLEDLLTLARSEDSVTNKTRVHLPTVVEESWHTVETADAVLEIDVDRAVRADESRLKQVFENLVRNAVEHGGESVTVTVEPLDDGFAIEDDGPGIPSDSRDDIFDAGYSETDGGTGFGLAIVEQIVGIHGWDISVTEGSEGGARFEITGVGFAE